MFARRGPSDFINAASGTRMKPPTSIRGSRLLDATWTARQVEVGMGKYAMRPRNIRRCDRGETIRSSIRVFGCEGSSSAAPADRSPNQAMVRSVQGICFRDRPRCRTTCEGSISASAARPPVQIPEPYQQEGGKAHLMGGLDQWSTRPSGPHQGQRQEREIGTRLPRAAARRTSWEDTGLAEVREDIRTPSRRTSGSRAPRVATKVRLDQGAHLTECLRSNGDSAKTSEGQGSAGQVRARRPQR